MAIVTLWLNPYFYFLFFIPDFHPYFIDLYLPLFKHTYRLLFGVVKIFIQLSRSQSTATTEGVNNRDTLSVPGMT